MALTVPQYVAAMRARQEKLAPLLGVDIRGLPPEFRAILTCSNAMTAVCMRVLSLAGIVTDAQLAAAFDDALAQVFPVEPPGQSIDPALTP